eukprot:CAMPEP_0203854002 /NCGR_PEP_ID=MMETSP0359-20131031/8862_1 /ASSEMBLY_ACC=CAM_ASM_000338 /TAXON_ID=268821 /ORGANISM="Scrippsiella Hangoei, Strain SHTV-5" /LENGTH=92 /DNA_ID=CAMNT_0050770445 /DNA_START=104 /DNA_END=379 /DNA_ORIENTATION=+
MSFPQAASTQLAHERAREGACAECRAHECETPNSAYAQMDSTPGGSIMDRPPPSNPAGACRASATNSNLQRSRRTIIMWTKTYGNAAKNIPD